MSYENIKSVLLTLLVIMSLILTWNLWTYQPEYGLIESTRYISDVDIGEKRELQELIQPSKVLFHKNGRHYGTTDTIEMKKALSHIRQWSFNDFSDITPSIREGYLDFVHGRDSVEIIFPSEVPVEILKSVLPIVDEELRLVTFDRVIIPMQDSQKEEPVAYFVSYEDHYVYKATINSFLYQTFFKEIYQVSPRYPQYFAYKIDGYTSLFLPDDKVNVNRITYYSIQLSGEDFKDALFTDPSIAKRDIQPNGDESYSDGARALYIFNGGNLLQFINPVTETDSPIIGSKQLIQQSIDFINDHSGWTDQYVMFDWDSALQSTEFRLQINGMPVFNYAGLSRISQEWNKTNMFDKYERPMFKLQLSLDSESSNVSLPSGHTLLDLLRQMPSFDPNKLEDALVGYELVKDRTSAKVTIEPMWIVNYNGSWKKIIFDDMRELGGNVIGLE
ncbi:YycH family regulatory protein [Bacillus salitolerans]|uniref:YycH family regulatory protein n=1 Tax=Bacillus salitolerans TaxID=1437434 RepID=A0ABW4LIL5_9BACI